MTKAEAIAMLKRIQEPEAWEPQINQAAFEALDMAIEALEPKPYEKFESAKDHIYKLAGDYKCWDNRLTKDEAVELCHILEQQPCEDTISRQAAIDAIRKIYDSVGILGEKWAVDKCQMAIKDLPSAQTEQHEIGYSECANAMLKMWIDNALTDDEYNRIMDRLNAHHNAGRKQAESEDEK